MKKHKTNKAKQVRTAVRCGVCGVQVDLDWLRRYEPGNDTQIVLCRYCSGCNE